MPHDKLSIYRATRYRVFELDTELIVDQPNGPLDRHLSAAGEKTFAYITAWNPRSRELPLAENLERNRQLEQDLRDYPCLHGEGAGLDPRWTPESSFIPIGIDRETAQQLAAKYDQDAYLFGRLGEPVRLIWVEPQDQSNEPRSSGSQ